MIRASLKSFALLLVVSACDAQTPQERSDLEPPDSAQLSGPAERRDPADQPEPHLQLLTPDGWGPLRIGMSRDEVVRAAGEDARPEAVGGPEPRMCDEFRPRHAPEGVLVMIENGVLTRISVSRSSEIATPAGIRVGDPAATVLEKYGGQARIEPHKYWEPPARYITVWRASPADTARRGIRYEISPEDEVVHLRAGGVSIEYVEGCL